ncbi:MAG: 4Fe-4S binding protein [Candidatus Cloacimonetes bacterium]|nr:4Fe-4S binding protein [Candidatus Cloacimonadota bacterium]
MDCKTFKIRKLIQQISLAGWILLILSLISELLKTAHAYCPYAAICFGTWQLKGIAVYTLTASIGLILAFGTIFFGRIFCGYVCFWGTLQEYLYRISPLMKFKHLVNDKVHRVLLKLKYLILIITFLLILLRLPFIYMKFCPVLAISHPFQIGVAAIIIFLLIIVGGLFIERFWCRYLCPYAALMNVFQLLGRVFGFGRSSIVRNISVSLNCPQCRNYCPMQIKIGSENVITDIECIHCRRCVRICTRDKSSSGSCIYRDNL